MRTRITLLALAAMLTLTSVSTASAQTSLKRSYLRDYRQATRSFGSQTVGRNIVRHGIVVGHHSRKATRAEIRTSYKTMERWLHPPIVSYSHSTTTTTTVSHGYTTSSSGGGGGAGGLAACIRQRESGGNYSTNTGNGYYGAYQFDLQTWHAAGGTGNPASASPDEQDRVFSHWYASHPGAWPVTGPACGGGA